MRSAVHELLPELRRLTAELIAYPSVGGSPDEARVQEVAAHWLRSHGLEVEVRSVPIPSTDVGFPGMEVERDQLVLVVARARGSGGGPDLVLAGHTDVVPSTDPQSFISRWVDDRLFGRGATDMKSGFAACCIAAVAVARSGVPIRGDLLVLPVSAEEDGGAGSFAVLADGLDLAPGSAALIAEPTDGRIFTANAGCLTFRIALRGRAAHGALRWRGVNPIEHIAPILDALRELEARRCAGAGALFDDWPLAYPISVGTVSGGNWASTVPDELTLTGRYGVRLGESFEQAQAHFEAAVADVARSHPWLAVCPPTVTWWGARFASAQTPSEHPLVGALTRAGAPSRVAAAPYGSDQRLFNAVGIPAVLFGPGRPSDAHSEPESVLWAQVEECAATIAVAAADFCRLPADAQ